jgi:predicted Co/Zn/Cd cation transporter (cation efflux family)
MYRVKREKSAVVLTKRPRDGKRKQICSQCREILRLAPESAHQNANNQNPNATTKFQNQGGKMPEAPPGDVSEL